jgi:hypothetical protein
LVDQTEKKHLQNQSLRYRNLLLRKNSRLVLQKAIQYLQRQRQNHWSQRILTTKRMVILANRNLEKLMVNRMEEVSRYRKQRQTIRMMKSINQIQ